MKDYDKKAWELCELLNVRYLEPLCEKKKALGNYDPAASLEARAEYYRTQLDIMALYQIMGAVTKETELTKAQDEYYALAQAGQLDAAELTYKRVKKLEREMSAFRKSIDTSGINPGSPREAIDIFLQAAAV